MTRFGESAVEDAALEWLQALGYAVVHGPAIAPGEPGAERDGYGQVVLARRLLEALGRLNPELPGEAIDDALRRVTHPEGATLEARNRAFHRMLVEGVTVEHRRRDGSIGGAQVRVIAFDSVEANDWLAVNQLTVVESKQTRRPSRTTPVIGVLGKPCHLSGVGRENGTPRHGTGITFRPVPSRAMRFHSVLDSGSPARTASDYWVTGNAALIADTPSTPAISHIGWEKSFCKLGTATRPM